MNFRLAATSVLNHTERKEHKDQLLPQRSRRSVTLHSEGRAFARPVSLSMGSLRSLWLKLSLSFVPVRRAGGLPMN
ncbi:MAG: hypothetical protein WCK89_16255, partial [bacterium]